MHGQNEVRAGERASRHVAMTNQGITWAHSVTDADVTDAAAERGHSVGHYARVIIGQRVRRRDLADTWHGTRCRKAQALVTTALHRFDWTPFDSAFDAIPLRLRCRSTSNHSGAAVESRRTGVESKSANAVSESVIFRSCIFSRPES